MEEELNNLKPKTSTLDLTRGGRITRPQIEKANISAQNHLTALLSGCETLTDSIASLSPKERRKIEFKSDVVFDLIKSNTITKDVTKRMYDCNIHTILTFLPSKPTEESSLKRLNADIFMAFSILQEYTGITLLDILRLRPGYYISITNNENTNEKLYFYRSITGKLDSSEDVYKSKVYLYYKDPRERYSFESKQVRSGLLNRVYNYTNRVFLKKKSFDALYEELRSKLLIIKGDPDTNLPTGRRGRKRITKRKQKRTHGKHTSKIQTKMLTKKHKNRYFN